MYFGINTISLVKYCVRVLLTTICFIIYHCGLWIDLLVGESTRKFFIISCNLLFICMFIFCLLFFISSHMQPTIRVLSIMRKYEKEKKEVFAVKS